MFFIQSKCYYFVRNIFDGESSNLCHFKPMNIDEIKYGVFLLIIFDNVKIEKM